MTALYVSQGRALLFADEAITEGIGPASRLLLKFGVLFFDYDLDGRLDLLTCNGHLEEEISKVQESQKYAQPAQLFWNCGPDEEAAASCRSARKKRAPIFSSRSSAAARAYADIDGDGDLGCRAHCKPAGRPFSCATIKQLRQHWLRLKLVGNKIQSRRHRRVDRSRKPAAKPLAAGDADAQLSFAIGTADHLRPRQRNENRFDPNQMAGRRSSNSSGAR